MAKLFIAYLPRGRSGNVFREHGFAKQNEALEELARRARAVL